MANKSWTVTLDGTPHTITLDHSSVSGKRSITVDGRLVASTKANVLDIGSEDKFTIGNHTCIVAVGSKGMNVNYDLVVDGRSITTGQSHVEVPQIPLPRWAWLFIVACLAIPVVSLGGAIPGALGAGGAVFCHIVARAPAASLIMRVGLCVGITVIVWLIFFAFGFAVLPTRR